MLWGVVLASMAACTSYAGLMICRVLLGIFEAPVAPILVLIVAMWYKKEEQGRRVSYFYVCNSITQVVRHLTFRKTAALKRESFGLAPVLPTQLSDCL